MTMESNSQQSVSSNTGAPDQLRDIKGLEHFSYPIWFYIVPAIIFAAAIVITARWLIRRRKPQTMETVSTPEQMITIPLIERARTRLNALRSHSDFSPDGEITFFFELSAALRLYIEAIYGFNATDMTTDEIDTRIENNNIFDSSKRTEILSILSACDESKFASEIFGKDRALAILERATVLIDWMTNLNHGTD